jgi:nucleoside-diphosphate-sugar epimerase
MKVAITGSSGYVGGAIKRSLLQANVEILELRRLRDGESPSAEISPFCLGETPSKDSLRGCDALIHCAYDLSAVAWADIERINVEGSKKLIDTAQSVGIKRIILISSISAYPSCISLYGRAKMEIEKMVERISGIVVRPGLVYGESPGGMMGTLSRFVTRLPLVPVIGGGQAMYLVHQDDLAEMIKTLIHVPEPPTLPLYACSENPVRFDEILRLLARKSNAQPLFFPLAWRLAWLGLRIAEVMGVRVGVKSDSLLSMMNPNPEPEFNATRSLGLSFRNF